MSASANTQVHVPRPKVWQAFEKGSAHLWRKILQDPSLHRFGRNGQAQHGMDKFGYRNGDTGKVVGVQCKCKGLGEQATQTELREDFEKALKYEPKLTEYFFTTTADDDAPLQTFAAKLTEEQRLLGRHIIVRAWGWGTLEDEMSAYPDVALVFDPNHSPTAELQTERHNELLAFQSDAKLEILAEVRAITASLAQSSAPDATSSAASPAEAVKANIAHCLLKLGDETAAAAMLEEAVAHAPDDPKAAANLVLAMMLRGNHKEAVDRALIELEKAPDNEGLAGYAVQAAGYAGVPDITSRIPVALRDSEAVQKYTLLNLRNAADPRWMELARVGRGRDEKDEFYKRQAAEADIQEVIEGGHKTSWTLTAENRSSLRRAADDLIALWNDAKTEEAPERPDTLAVCMNATLALSALGEKLEARDLITDGLAVSQGKDAELVVRVAAVALEAGDKQLSEETFPKLANEAEGLLLRSQIAARYGNWDYLASIAGSAALDTVPASERDLIKAITASAAIKKGAKTDPATASADLVALTKEFEASGRASVLVAQVAEDLDLPEIASSAYSNALATITDTSHIASRLMVAGYAAQRHDHAAVIKLMDGFVDTAIDNSDLLQLASAFAYEIPATGPGSRVFCRFA